MLTKREKSVDKRKEKPTTLTSAGATTHGCFILFYYLFSKTDKKNVGDGVSYTYKFLLLFFLFN